MVAYVPFLETSKSDPSACTKFTMDADPPSIQVEFMSIDANFVSITCSLRSKSDLTDVLAIASSHPFD